MLSSCASPVNVPTEADARVAVGADGGEVDPCAASPGPGRHRLFVQGHDAPARADGAYPLLHDHRLCDDAVFVDDTNGDGVWQPGESPRPLGPPELVHGEHFLVGAGAYAEFRFPYCRPLRDQVAFYIPNFDVTGSRARHQLLVETPAGESVLAEAIDDEEGSSGYNPFVRVLPVAAAAVDPPGELVLRTTNLNGFQFSVMVWRPPSEYESWILVDLF